MRRPTVLLLGASLLTACAAPRDGAVPTTPLGRAAHDIVLRSEKIVVSARVTAGATLASILRAQNLAADEAQRLIERAASVFDVRKVRTNQPYRIERAADGALRTFEYEIDGDRFLRVSRSVDRGFEAGVLPIAKTLEAGHVTGVIDRQAPSLVAAMDAAGEAIDLTLALADILGGEIDFSTELQPGDRFDVTVPKQYRDGHTFAGYAPIEAVEFVNAGRMVRAIRFTPEGGQPGYYDQRGNSMKRFFLASPLKFQPVVTSGFTYRRMHPILREFRAHLGVDYRAPEGSPVVAVADGVVLSAGMAGASGRLVHLRHANGFESEYLHLSAIAVRSGQHVRQGELIGRVGSSGLATGAHVDYRLKKNGAFINPVTAHRAMPPGEPVPASQLAAFAAVRDRLFAPARTPAAARVVNPNSSGR